LERVSLKVVNNGASGVRKARTKMTMDKSLAKRATLASTVINWSSKNANHVLVVGNDLQKTKTAYTAYTAQSEKRPTTVRSPSAALPADLERTDCSIAHALNVLRDTIKMHAEKRNAHYVRLEEHRTRNTPLAMYLIGKQWQAVTTTTNISTIHRLKNKTGHVNHVHSVPTAKVTLI